MAIQQESKLERGNRIKIDIDNAMIPYNRIRHCIEFLTKTSGYMDCRLKFKKATVLTRNKTHHHIEFEVNSIYIGYLPFVQVAFGSDFKRELFNFARLFSIADFNEQNVLFKGRGYNVNKTAENKINRMIHKVNYDVA